MGLNIECCLFQNLPHVTVDCNSLFSRKFNFLQFVFVNSPVRHYKISRVFHFMDTPGNNTTNLVKSFS